MKDIKENEHVERADVVLGLRRSLGSSERQLSSSGRQEPCAQRAAFLFLFLFCFVFSSFFPQASLLPPTNQSIAMARCKTREMNRLNGRFPSLKPRLMEYPRTMTTKPRTLIRIW
jgi:hypothetical protein